MVLCLAYPCLLPIVLSLQELVQVESLAQLGVQLLLFGLGLELSPSKLRAVWDVAIMGERAAAVHGLGGGLGLSCPARAFMTSGSRGCL